MLCCIRARFVGLGYNIEGRYTLLNVLLSGMMAVHSSCDS